MSKYYGFHDKNFLGNHKHTASHFICILSFGGKLTKYVEIYTQNLAPTWPKLVSNKESITQWYHISAYQAFISLYVCDFAYVPVAGNMCDFQYHGLNAGRSVDSLKQQKHSGILVARYPRIYKEIIICDPDTNLKAKRNRNTLRFLLHRYHFFAVDVTMISVALPISFWRRELPDQDRTEELPRSSVFFVHQFTAVLSNSITDSGIT